MDRSEEVLAHSEDTLDVLCIKGNGANAQTLIEAEVDKADIVIAATASDEINMLCCLMAKKLGAGYAIARIRDPEYNQSLTMLQREMDIDMTINPERATALEISRLLRFPFASNIESFARGRVEMVEFHVHENDPIVGVPMKELSKRLRGIPQVLYCAIDRDGEVIIPSGDTTILSGDKVHVAADMITITAYFRFLGKYSKRVKNVMILGGGKISYYLAKMLAPTGVQVSIIEESRQAARELAEMLPEVTVICGDGTDQDVLEQEGLGHTDAFVTLAERDEENFMTGLYAVKRGVPKVIVKNTHSFYVDLIADMGLESVVSPKAITCSTILRYVRARTASEGSAVEKLYRRVDGKVEALEFVAQAGAPYIGRPLKELTIRKNTRVAVIVRHGRVIVPFGNDHIEAGDSVIIVASESGLGDLNEVIMD